ncbi:hypothetical protein PQJ75_13575 [Rhodoplanes sp. TEM]|uniref:Uncharacterized protein n=1 Tax=Rhodoplanes tepidamans TaxID=200616 RepID=A0ABT5JCX4_RHOTP|nr:MULTISPECIES: hypothetical protein [Rhodoplanes]MDC7787358.1 hypothetical protein [Rhodoplanes tepidamans]MDC7984760.1 hypothetical protein [Rhodoplanes sp. TEM]MDQ0358269.1 hypothetical protein [Rhodoplanes tepidamans]
MTDGTPMADEPAALHRVAQGIIAARDARISALEVEVTRLSDIIARAKAAAISDGATVEGFVAALAAVQATLRGVR